MIIFLEKRRNHVILVGKSAVLSTLVHPADVWTHDSFLKLFFSICAAQRQHCGPSLSSDAAKLFAPSFLHATLFYSMYIVENQCSWSCLLWLEGTCSGSWCHRDVYDSSCEVNLVVAGAQVRSVSQLYDLKSCGCQVKQDVKKALTSFSVGNFPVARDV